MKKLEITVLGRVPAPVAVMTEILLKLCCAEQVIYNVPSQTLILFMPVAKVTIGATHECLIAIVTASDCTLTAQMPISRISATRSV